MIDDKFLALTAFLRQQHDLGNNILQISATQLQELCGPSFKVTPKAKHTINDSSNACAIGWLLADYVAVDFNKDSQNYILQYNPDKVEDVLIADYH